MSEYDVCECCGRRLHRPEAHGITIDRETRRRIRHLGIGIGALVVLWIIAAPHRSEAQGRLPQCPADTSVPWNNCEGALTMPNGDKYVGEFRDGKPNGQGVITWTNGSKYVGGISDGKMNGKGTLTWADGTISVGEFRDGRPNGVSVTPHPPVEKQESSSAEEVPLKKNRGIFVVPVEINGAVILDFAVDSGASTVTIPANVYDRLVGNGTIRSVHPRKRDERTAPQSRAADRDRYRVVSSW